MNCRRKARELRVALLTARDLLVSEVQLLRGWAARALFS
jgi:hypothetical protein